VQAELIERHRPAVELLRVKRAVETAVQTKRPTVVGTHKALHVAAVGLADHRATVRAAVVEHLHPAVLVAHQNDRIQPQRTRHVIAGVRDLALQAHEHPGPGEDALHLQLEQRLVHEQAAAREPLLHIHQRRRAGCVQNFRCRHLASSVRFSPARSLRQAPAAAGSDMLPGAPDWPRAARLIE
jgi:hypothetical protein